jgi:hypothetical protein
LGPREPTQPWPEQCGLAGASLLILGPEPIPALARIGGGYLRGIDDEEGVELGQRIHKRVRGKIVRVLSTAMEHDEERQGLARIATRDIQLVRACPKGIGLGPVHLFSTLVWFSIDPVHLTGHLADLAVLASASPGGRP